MSVSSETALSPDRTGVTGAYSWALFTVPGSRADDPYVNDLVIDPKSMTAWFDDRVIVVSEGLRTVWDSFTVTALEKNRRVPDEDFDFAGQVYVVPLEARGDTERLGPQECVVFALGGFEFSLRAKGRFDSNAMMWGRADVVLTVHSMEHLKSVLLADGVRPLVSWVCLLVAARMPHLSLELVRSLVEARIDDLLDHSTHQVSGASMSGASIAANDLVGRLTGVTDQVNAPWMIEGELNDAVWWYTYRVAHDYVDAVTVGGVNVSPTWVQVDLDEGCAPACRSLVDAAYAPVDVADPGVGDGLFASGAFVGVDASAYTRFTAGAGFVPVPVSVAGLNEKQGAELNELLLSLLRWRTFTMDVSARAALGLVAKHGADFPLTVVTGAVCYMPLRADFFDLLTAALTELDSLGTLMFAASTYHENLPGLSVIPCRVTSLSYRDVPLKYLLSGSVSYAQAAELEGMVLDRCATIGSDGLETTDSIEVARVTWAHLYANVGRVVTNFFAEPEHDAVSLRWYLNLFGIVTR